MEAKIIEMICFNRPVFSNNSSCRLGEFDHEERRDVLGISQNRRFGDVPLVCGKQEDISA